MSYRRKSVFRNKQRKILERYWWPWRSLVNKLPPHEGWVKLVRTSNGLSTRALANELGVSHTAILKIEKSEQRKKISLETLSKVASAFQYSLVYAILPKEKEEITIDLASHLQKIARKRQKEIARLKRLRHSTSL